MGVVHYFDFREHERQMVQTNDTMMGLLAGSKLAAQTLSLTAGSKHLMSEIFPNVEHIHRFNLTTSKAQEVLGKAEGLLGILAVPQVLALQEDLMVGMLSLLEKNLQGIGNVTDGAKSSNAHERFQTITNEMFDAHSLSLFHLVRKARNTHIHSGGKANQSFVNAIQSIDPQSAQIWEAVTKTKLPLYKKGQNVRMGLPELIGSLAITRRLSEEANLMLQKTLPKNSWADIAVSDWLETRKPGDKNQQDRQLRGIVRQYYGPVGLSEDDLVGAKSRAGIS